MSFRVFCLFVGFAGYALVARPHLPAADDPIFIESAAATGLAFTHVNGATGNYYLPEMMGAGVALFDYDNDGDLDVFLVQGGALPSPAREAPTSRLFRNDLTIGADSRRTLHFTDVTERSGAGIRGYGMGAAVGDYDNDGYLDLLVTSFGSIALLHNNGNGTFTDVTRQAGISDSAWSTSAAFFDYDRDGYLDLFVARYVDFTAAANKLCNDPVGTRDYCSPRVYRPVPARLFRNDGRGHFVDVTARAVDRLRHRLDRLRQRRVAGSVRRQWRRQHRGVASRAAGAVPDEESAFPEQRHGTLRGDERVRGSCLRTRRDQQRRGIRRHRQRRRRRHRVHEQQRAGAAAPQPDWRAESLDSGASRRAAGESIRHRQLGRRRAIGPSHALAPREDGWQLPVGKRRACAFRARVVGGRQRRCRPVA